MSVNSQNMGGGGHISMVSCQEGPTHIAFALQIGAFWQDTLVMASMAIFKLLDTENEEE